MLKEVIRNWTDDGYSARIVASGSTAAAQKAGRMLPATVMTRARRAAAPYTNGSAGLTPNSRDLNI